MQLIMVRWCGVLGAEQCWLVLWAPHGRLWLYYIHAQSIVATYFTGAVKSDVVHLIMVCWAFLLQSLSELNRFVTLGGQQKYLLMPA